MLILYLKIQCGIGQIWCYQIYLLIPVTRQFPDAAASLGRRRLFLLRNHDVNLMLTLIGKRHAPRAFCEPTMLYVNLLHDDLGYVM
jgi:hypothetical protein